MPQDLLQIALEHHRAGRLTQAQSGYQAVLSNDPTNPEAQHWLGVLHFQAGQFEQAIPLLESAAAQRPDDPAYQHNLGQAYSRAQRKDQAILAFERAITAAPAGHEALVALAQARLSRGRTGDADAAVAALKQAQAAGLVTGESFHHLGVALLAAGRFAEAAGACRTANGKNQNDALAYYHLALASRGIGDTKETRKALIKALEIDPAMAQAWCALAMLDMEAGNCTSAAGLFRRAIAADRFFVDAYRGLSHALQQMGDATGARAALEQAQKNSQPDKATPAAPASVADLERHLTLTPRQAQAHFAMAALMNIFPPSQTPGQSVSDLFDRYAPKFDSHLVDKLDYHVPEAILDALRPLWNGQPLDIFDAGCGTGLCGKLLKPMARTLVGVDLSSAMIEKAREKKVYDRLEVGDLIEALKRSPASYDLLVCADVLVYVGEAAPFFDAAAAALRPGGLLSYSVEAGGGDRYELVPQSRRFTHSKPYIQRMAAIYGLEEVHFQTIMVRRERDQPVNGYLIVVRK